MANFTKLKIKNILLDKTADLTLDSVGLTVTPYPNDPLFLSNILTVLPTGKVGIGKTDPAYSLDIVGDVNLTGSIKINGNLLSSDGV